MAKKHGLGSWVAKLIRDNRRGCCVATRKEVDMLARCVEEERVSRSDIPAILGKSYRQCLRDKDFKKIRKQSHVGVYNKTDVVLKSKKKWKNQ